ncbi:MAG: hypothetical protein JWN41_740 [Thermoleophilia bacterium]|nr:hypothetical protein [Thermoleophilia bacterium]
MRRSSIALLTVVAFTWFTGASASAYTAQVVPAGGATIDVGEDVRAQVIHSVLVHATDALTVTLVMPSKPIAIDVLVPDQPQERGVTPTYSVRRDASSNEAAATSSTAHLPAPHGSRLFDRVTGITYRRIHRFDPSDLSLPGHGVTLTVTRGATPLRIALRIDDGSPMRLSHPASVPQTVSRLGAWFTQPAPGAARAVSHHAARRLRSLVWVPFGIAALTLSTAVWWAIRGRRTARVRGIEREVADRTSRDQ